MTTRGYMSANACAAMAVAVSVGVWVSEIARLNVPWVQQAFMATFMGKIMREREITQVGPPPPPPPPPPAHIMYIYTLRSI